MGTQPNSTEGLSTESVAPPAVQPPQLDPLRRVFVPLERRTSAGTIVFRTTDKELYCRVDEGMPMQRVNKKIRGKAARRASKIARRMEREGVKHV